MENKKEKLGSCWLLLFLVIAIIVTQQVCCFTKYSLHLDPWHSTGISGVCRYALYLNGQSFSGKGLSIFFSHPISSPVRVG